ncbi:hypothetical protein BgAZ_300290 [Babesia gibsoni]|uniref:SANT domain-containing protein n=1 Tax=Babesia gibsoni TaxID=33632 RepID=A0AAD8LPH5_BABGI|nr:hypothetical protein BgAZ_300290 [Babesia gibsoni]
MEQGGKSLPPGALEGLSPSIALYRRMKGISPTSHDEFMAHLSERLSSRIGKSPLPRHRYTSDDGESQSMDDHTTPGPTYSRVTPPPRERHMQTPEKPSVHYTGITQFTPPKNDGTHIHSNRGSTMTPTKSHFNPPFMKHLMSSCSSLRFNSSSLVTYPYLYCNNTFVKMKLEDVFDPRVGRKRVKADYVKPVDKRGKERPIEPKRRTRQQGHDKYDLWEDVNEDYSLSLLQAHYDYASDPYKRRYESNIKERRRLLRTDSSDFKEPTLSALRKLVKSSRPSYKKKEVSVSYEDEKDNDILYALELASPTIPAAGDITPMYRKLCSLSEEDKASIQHLNDKRRLVDSEMMTETLDLLKVVALLKQLVRGAEVNGTTRRSLLTLFKDLDTLTEMEHIIETLLKETEDTIIMLQYSKFLLNGNMSQQESLVSAQIASDVADAEFDMAISDDNPSKRERNMTSTPSSNYLRDDFTPTSGRDLVAASPCLSFVSGLNCIKGVCSTSVESFNASKPTDCLSAAGCYLWDPELLSRENNNEVYTTKTVEHNVNVERDSKAETLEEEVKGESDAESDETEDYVLGRTGAWTDDSAFSQTIMEQNCKRNYDAIKPFLKDLCDLALAEVLIPKPEWKGVNEYRCINDSCCQRCCTCADGSTNAEMLLNTPSQNWSEENIDTKFELETAVAMIDLHKTLLGKCICICRCGTHMNAMDQVVRDHTAHKTIMNGGIIWHDVEPSEQLNDSQGHRIINDVVFQERITLRIKSDCLPAGWRERAPFICKLNIQFVDEDDRCIEDCSTEATGIGDANNIKGEHDIECNHAVDIMNYSNLNEGYMTDGSDMDVVDEQVVYVPPPASHSALPRGADTASKVLVPEFKTLVDFTMWDALHILTQEQTELHNLKGEGLEYFDPLETSTKNIPVETLRLTFNSLVSETTDEAYVDIALYLPYVPSTNLPWKFESITPIDIMDKSAYLGPEVVADSIENVVAKCNEDGVIPNKPESRDDNAVDAMLQHPLPGRQTYSNAANGIKTDDSSDNSISMDEYSSYGDISFGDDTTSYADDAFSFARDSVFDEKEPTKDELVCNAIFKDMVILPEDTQHVLAFLREHILMRNEILYKEAEACRAYIQMWQTHLRRLKSRAPQVDIFAWGILPVRAMDLPDMFIPLPAGYKQNDINWPYTSNNVISPFRIDSFGLWDLDGKVQVFNTMRHRSQEDVEEDSPSADQLYTARKLISARRRGPGDSENAEPQDDEANRATVWLAPNYSNLTGPGIRWTYSCMNSVDEPMRCIPDFNAVPIYRIMRSPEFGVYKLDNCLTYERRNALRPDEVIQEDVMTRMTNMWTKNECRIFIEKYLMYPKNFSKIAQFIETKRCGDCVDFYYRFKYRLKLKERLMDLKEKPRNKNEMSRFLRRDMHVIQALDSLFDDCHTEKMEAVCSQNSISLGGVSEYLLRAGGLDTGRKYEIALTQHRGNWSPLDEDINLVLDNLNEGYFIPTKFRCMVTRKNIEVPLSLAADSDEITIKRGCFVINGNRDFNKLEQLRSLISAIKTEHVLSLKPVYCRRITGRSVLEALYDKPVEQIIIMNPPPTDVNYEMEKRATKRDSVDNHLDVTYNDAMLDTPTSRLQGGNSMRTRVNNLKVQPTVDSARAKHSQRRNVRNPIANSDYIDPVSEFSFSHAKLPKRSKKNPKLAKKHPEERLSFLEEEDVIPSGSNFHVVVPVMSRTRRKRIPTYKADHVDNSEIHVKPKKNKQRKRPPVVRSLPPPDAPLESPRSMVEWNDEEISEFVRLFRIYGEDWDIIEKHMSPYGKSRDDIISYYVMRLTNNVLKRSAEEEEV